jgi:hypothetical protein
MHNLSEQLEMFGLDGARRLAETATTSTRERSRLLRRIDVTHELMSELPAGEDLSFLHSGLCQTCCRTAAQLRTMPFGSVSPVGFR